MATQAAFVNSLRTPEDGVEGINAFLRPHSKTFDEVYADWIAANYLDSETGPYGYSKHQIQVANESTGLTNPAKRRDISRHTPRGTSISGRCREISSWSSRVIQRLDRSQPNATAVISAGGVIAATP